MKKLNFLLKGIEEYKIWGNIDSDISNITFDSRNVSENNLFIAIKGTQIDGHLFIEQAINKGATTIACEILPEIIHDNVTYVLFKDSSYALGYLASNYFDNPSQKLKLVGVTGTNGKTTTATMLYNLFKELGYKVGLISTIKNKIDNTEIPSTHTTPDSVKINELISEMVIKGCQYCFMEVSSHAVIQNRISALHFSGGIFSNITHDHLDFHKTFSEYIKAKQLFFEKLPENAFALTNADDKNGKVMVQNTKAKVYTYGLKNIADFKCKIIENDLFGLLLNIDGNDVAIKLVGKFNAYNSLAVYATSVLLQQKKTDILKAISIIDGAEGRFEHIKSKNNITAIVDYAHTPDALLNVLETIEHLRTKNEKLITIIGAGGNRDAKKRPVMARIAAENSDLVILTSDNPRNEDPEEILKQMELGIDITLKKKVLKITNRKEAIKTACMLANSGDIILVAGKGHENYQEIKGVKYHFDDKEILNMFLI